MKTAEASSKASVRHRLSHRALNPTPGHGTAGVGARELRGPAATLRGSLPGQQSGSLSSPFGKGRGGPLPAGAAALFSLARQRGWPSLIGASRAVPASGPVAGDGSFSPTPHSCVPRRAAQPAGPRGWVLAPLCSHGRAATRVVPGLPRCGPAAASPWSLSGHVGQRERRREPCGLILGQ